LSVINFFKRYVAHPDQVGAIAPTSKSVGRVVCDAAHVGDVASVVELGPGDGAITRVIVEQLRPNATFFAIEISPEFCKAMAERFPEVTVYNDSAEQIGAYLAQHNLDACDAIVSGLPWASFPESLQTTLLDAVYSALKPGGRFTTYTYLFSPLLSKGKRFREMLEDRFGEVQVTPLIWANVPPAFVYVAEK
jgi:phosphatidylethanolamine/phosphatidyl-N-methylethanolamine N-methyltransferase